ncbi:tetratricopeptide repeat protein [Nitratiruptor sp. YY09-18]|uniref:tetratricopeptide repeat protein n=1 Tax=Nitratiruptor sp. YY09-18 TaxID=2724901 RepID=UPI001915043D|nr:tetratricopeptide repeat protein [Nitratiruptor sp. YY09-18]
MSKFKHLLLLFAVVFATAQTVTPKVLDKIYKNALHDFRVGSYYQALDEFNYIIKYPKSKYFLPSLFMLAYTYLYIGKRIGDKKYLWSAVNYLNLYVAKGGKKDAKYYYLKGLIYENLGFFERAYTSYKMALEKSIDKSEKLNILMGLLRSAVWLGKMDLATKYYVILNIEQLSAKQQKEFSFLQGMYYFAKKDYKKALQFFKKTYKEFESYLIENPQYYYLVAESAYRYGDYRFSELLFRRILTYVRNKEVIQKSLLRLGDIKFLQKDYHSSANYYIRLIKTFPKSKLATVAKLKLLYLIKQDKKLAHYIKKYLDDPFLQDPLRFIVETLVKNRTNYIGIFALANFGLETFEIGSDKLYTRLAWELSLVNPNSLKFEQIEYFRRLWEPYIVKDKHICQLYTANRDFFINVFPKATLLQIVQNLKKCKSKKEAIDLLQKLTQKYRDDDLYYELANFYYEAKEYKKSYEILDNIQKHDCKYYKSKAQICYILSLDCRDVLQKAVSGCAKDFYAVIFEAVLQLKQDRIDKNLFVNYKEDFIKNYKDPVVQKFLHDLVQKLIEKELYGTIIEILQPLSNQMHSDCFLSSVLALSYVRLGKVDLAQELMKNVNGCSNSWYNLAKIAIEDAKLQKQIEDE